MREYECGVEDLVTLFRPTGPKELALVAASAWKRWPPRLPEQPIFNRVTNEAYAREIAERWNVKESGSGFVTRFAVRKAFLDRYERQVVGAREHEEYWIPAEDLEALNDSIVGEIEVIASYGAPIHTAELQSRQRWFEQYRRDREDSSHSRSSARPRAGSRFPCPCCDCLTLDSRGDYEICPVCLWEDDGQDEHDADVVRGGPNGRLSLTLARQNYARIGAADERMLPHVRRPREDELPPGRE
jgi:hypothetical protein